MVVGRESLVASDERVLEIVGIVVVVALILIGSLMPLKYLSKYDLPKNKGDQNKDAGQDARREAD